MAALCGFLNLFNDVFCFSPSPSPKEWKDMTQSER